MQKAIKIGRILLSVVAVIVFAYGMIQFMIVSLQSVRDYKREISQGRVTSSGIVVYEEEKLKAPGTSESFQFFIVSISGMAVFLILNIHKIIKFGAEQNRYYQEERQAKKEQRRKEREEKQSGTDQFP